MFLMICGDVERLPEPYVTEHFPNTREIKIIRQNIRGLFTNIESLMLLLNTYKNIDIVTSETHIMYNSWKDNSTLYSIPGFTLMSKCPENGEGVGIGIYVVEKHKWKRTEDIKDVTTQGIWIEIFQTKANSFIAEIVYLPLETSTYLPQSLSIF